MLTSMTHQLFSALKAGGDEVFTKFTIGAKIVRI